MIAPLFIMPPVPIAPNHPGAFGIDRHLHVHTGVDLYTPHGSPVRATEAGKVISIAWFTGEVIAMPWWNNTRAVYIEGETGVFNYGEIQEVPGLKVGDTVKEGQIIGSVLTVLKKFKGRPMSMLHLELYDHGYTDTWGEWKIGEPKPEHLKDPTPYFWRMDEGRDYIVGIQNDPYIESAEYFKELNAKGILYNPQGDKGDV